ncbi:hypothetical protein EON83_24160 [bacterium]|nr:MAG: hypothetical protein EON83_24160 [bacterium]
MTPQQANALAHRLTRIWQPEEATSNLSNYGKFSFNGRWADGLNLRIEQEDELQIELLHDNQLLLTAYCDDLWDETDTCQPKQRQKVENLVAHHLPSFRRNSWLSGEDIEATPHEKAEWIQGFTHEELEAWNLKL